MQGAFDMRTTIRGRVPRIPFAEMARAILGAQYSLSLVICGDALAERLNATYRDKTYVPNVLSFPLSARDGEIFLNLRKAEQEARAGGISTKARTALLFVHACFHLKGFDHGDSMDAAEARILRAFGFSRDEN